MGLITVIRFERDDWCDDSRHDNRQNTASRASTYLERRRASACGRTYYKIWREEVVGDREASGLRLSLVETSIVARSITVDPIDSPKTKRDSSYNLLSTSVRAELTSADSRRGMCVSIGQVAPQLMQGNVSSGLVTLRDI
jgi:hypothetical protein